MAPYVGAPEIKARRLVLTVEYHGQIGNPDKTGTVNGGSTPDAEELNPHPARSCKLVLTRCPGPGLGRLSAPYGYRRNPPLLRTATTATTSAAAASVTIAAAPRRAGERDPNNAANHPMSTIGGPAISMSRSARRPASPSTSWKCPRPFVIGQVIDPTNNSSGLRPAKSRLRIRVPFVVGKSNSGIGSPARAASGANWKSRSKSPGVTCRSDTLHGDLLRCVIDRERP